MNELKRKERTWDNNKNGIDKGINDGSKSIEKVKYLSREEREKLALERRAREVEEKHQRLQQIQESREKFFEESKTLENDRDKERRRERDRERERRDRDRERREREREKQDQERKDQEKKEQEKKEQELKESERKELEIIKKEYLGLKKEKKKIQKLSEKFKINFDWDEKDDTSQDINPLYSSKLEVRPLFGRGYMGGIDKKEQIKETQKNHSNGDSSKTDSMSLDKKLSTVEKAELPTKHWSEKKLEQMKDRDWRIFKEDFNITTRGGNIPRPIRYWHESSLRKEILEAISFVGYKDPTPIQRQAIPVGLQGRDIIGIAETGSGKTAAFVIPMLEYILQQPKMTPESAVEGPYSLILAPTRELAQQIAEETEKFANFCGLRVLSIIGGISMDEQITIIRRGGEIAIATPGRLNDCLDNRLLVLNQCKYVVLDEADRMIDMGFEPQVRNILDAMPASNLKSEHEDEAILQEGRGYRTTTMYSATMPIGVERLARQYLRRPAYVIIGDVGKVVSRIEQVVEWVRTEEKPRHLVRLLGEGPEPPIIIFVNKKNTADAVGSQVRKLGYKYVILHSGKNQYQRESAITSFKAKQTDILIATDVAARGIDVPGVTHVINYDAPKNKEDYTHRSGRTGRAGLKGLVTTLLTSEDTDLFYDLKKILTEGNYIVPPELANHPAAQCKPGTIPEKKTRRDTIIYAKT